MVGLRAPPPLIKEIDAWAAANGVASRSDAIRRLIEHGLSSEANATKPLRPAPDEKDHAAGRSIREARNALEQSREKIELALAALARLVERSLASEAANTRTQTEGDKTMASKKQSRSKPAAGSGRMPKQIPPAKAKKAALQRKPK
jgi:Ribbon-helix-helix protein, copG family